MNSEMYVIFFMLTFKILKSSQWQTVDFCITPNGNYGNCVKLSECPSAMSYMCHPSNSWADKQQMLGEYTCEYNSLKRKVCCPQDNYYIQPSNSYRIFKKVDYFPHNAVQVLPQTKYYIKPSRSHHPSNVVVNQNNHLSSSSQNNNFGSHSTTHNVVHKNTYLLPPHCGISGKEEAVRADLKKTGSKEATLNEFPWMVLLSSNSTSKGHDFNCVGTIINERYILTTPECIINKQLFSVRVGLSNTETTFNCEESKNDKTGSFCPDQDIKIEKTVIHENFTRSNSRDAIALIRLSKPLNIYAENVRAICLPLHSSLNTIKYPDTPFVLTGWGVTKESSKSKVLLKVKTSLMTQEQCRKKYSRKILYVSDKQFCVTGQWNRKSDDPCNDNQGSPLQKLNGNRYTQYGILPFSRRNCGVYRKESFFNIRIDQYMDWILDTIEP